MRRSLREATIGFTLLTALAGGIGLWFWVSGAVFGQRTWSFRLRFDDAAGLSPQSSVSFRGVVVGAVRRVRADATGVRVDVQILEEQLRLPRPMVAQVRSALESGELKCSKRKVAEALSLSLEEVDRVFHHLLAEGVLGQGSNRHYHLSSQAG